MTHPDPNHNPSTSHHPSANAPQNIYNLPTQIQCRNRSQNRTVSPNQPQFAVHLPAQDDGAAQDRAAGFSQPSNFKEGYVPSEVGRQAGADDGIACIASQLLLYL
ncbi:hypothetical protein OCU04_004599 [Sclerotinia nivalis]|uniref:Uncharacterized protein n=1 Tax=Sclerotinia nivalis TaxID=352851 RepID=A0A9X0AQR7_9HELO|nr:hypothetical protein OCU04_004599 [Sclerotinia nivalis]